MKARTSLSFHHLILLHRHFLFNNQPTQKSDCQYTSNQNCCLGTENSLYLHPFILFPTPPIYKGNVIYLVLFSGRVQFFHYYFHRHSQTSTQPLLRENSVIFQRVTRAWPLFSPLVKIYVASLFNLISLKTNGGQQGFLDQPVPGKHLSHDCTHATNADTACTLCRILACIRD